MRSGLGNSPSCITDLPRGTKHSKLKNMHWWKRSGKGKIETCQSQQWHMVGHLWSLSSPGEIHCEVFGGAGMAKKGESQSNHVRTRKMVNYSWVGRSQGKPWWKSAAMLTCKSLVKPEYRGERPIEPSSSWFPPNFPAGLQGFVK